MRKETRELQIILGIIVGMIGCGLGRLVDELFLNEP